MLGHQWLTRGVSTTMLQPCCCKTSTSGMTVLAIRKALCLQVGVSDDHLPEWAQKGPAESGRPAEATGSCFAPLQWGLGACFQTYRMTAT